MAYDATPFYMPGERFRTPLESPTSHARWRAVRCIAFTFSLCAASAGAVETVRCALADGFDFPVGKPEGTAYYKSRGFYPNGHLGEDWNGRGGGDSDLGDPIYSIAGGVVVHSDNVGVGWGNVIIIRHAFRDAGGKIEVVDSLYGHLQERRLKLHQIVERGQLVGTMGSNSGMYPAHLHLEVRKNLQIGMNRSQFARDYSNYYSPTQFINAHRKLSSNLQRFEMPVNTFAGYGKSLADRDKAAPSGKGLTIPVFPSVIAAGNLPTVVLNPQGGKAIKPALGRPAVKPLPPVQKAPPEVSTGARPPRTAPPPAAPAPTAAVPDTEDFWTRLKSKLKQGQLTDDPQPRAIR